jgi:hypothetical protein
MARTVPKVPRPETASQLLGCYLLLNREEQKAFCRLLVDMELADADPSIIRPIFDGALRKLAENEGRVYRAYLQAADKAATAQGMLADVLDNYQPKRDINRDRLKIGKELIELKKTMTWPQVTKYVMAQRAEWVEATWAPRMGVTPDTEKQVYRYLQKIHTDTVAHYGPRPRRR